MSKIYLGDCLSVMKKLPDNSVDMVFTSPPYADRRSNVYEGHIQDEYVEWFIPISVEIKRILKDNGSFFLNIKPHTYKSERVLYVFDLVLSLKRKVGFKFVDEFCWVKNGYPGYFYGRFKNGFEPVYHFIKGDLSKSVFNPIACGTIMDKEAIKRSTRKCCGESKNGSGMGAIKASRLLDKEFARPSNVININNVLNQHSEGKSHPATFPEKLVEFFVKSFTNEGDLVLDPFAGSGTVGIVCKNLKREFILIEKERKYYDLIVSRFFKKNDGEE